MFVHSQISNLSSNSFTKKCTHYVMTPLLNCMFINSGVQVHEKWTENGEFEIWSHKTGGRLIQV
jgi:hypothetical protein